MTMSRSGGPNKRPDEVIVQVMKRRGIDPTTVHCKPGWPTFNPKDKSSIKGSRRYVLIRGYGHFFEPLCNRHWQSPYSWCVIDLQQQRIIYKYSQQCLRCKDYCKPDFKDDAKEKMAEYACKIFLRERTTFPNLGTPPDTVRGHHEVDLCEMCQSGYHCVKLSGSNSGQSRLNKTEVNRSVQYSTYSTEPAYYGHYCNSSYNTEPAHEPPRSQTKRSGCTIL